MRKDLEKVYDRINWTAMWDVLKVYDVGRRLVNDVKAFYRIANACIKVYREISKYFERQECVRQAV